MLPRAQISFVCGKPHERLRPATLITAYPGVFDQEVVSRPQAVLPKHFCPNQRSGVANPLHSGHPGLMHSLHTNRNDNHKNFYSTAYAAASSLPLSHPQRPSILSIFSSLPTSLPSTHISPQYLVFASIRKSIHSGSNIAAPASTASTALHEMSGRTQHVTKH